MKMYWMTERDRRLHDDIDPLVHVRQIEDEVAAVGRRGVICNDTDESRVFVLRVESRARKVPLEQIFAVGEHGHVAGESLIRAKCIDLCHGDERRQRFVDTLRGVVVRCCCGYSGEIFGTLVSDDAFDIERLGSPGACGLVVRPHPIVARRLRGLHEDHVALPDLNVDDVGFVWNNISEVHVDDLQLMTVNVELVRGLNGAIDEAQKVGFPGLKLDWQFEALTSLVSRALDTPSILAVDQTIVHGSRSTIDSILCIVIYRVHCLVSPVLEEYSTGIDVP